MAHKIIVLAITIEFISLLSNRTTTELGNISATYAIRQSIRTLFAEANRGLHVPQHLVHVVVVDFTSVTKNTKALLYLSTIDS